jgi:plasmid stabilization system protein ParE
MKLEWSDEALADLDRFVEFLGRERPSLAKIVATEIIDKVQVLSEHPQLSRPIAGREEYRQVVLQVLELRQPAHELGGKPADGGLQNNRHSPRPVRTSRVRKWRDIRASWSGGSGRRFKRRLR